MAAIEEARIAADAKVKPCQAAVKPGDCFVSDSGEGFAVLGEVLEGCPEGRLQHYRFSRCHSAVCPEGELGDVHVSTIRFVVTREFFEAMRSEGWLV